MVDSPTKRGPGRPPAKHSSPDYAQMSIYIHKAVRNAVKGELFKDAGEFSGLVETLLRGWLKDRGVKIPATSPSKKVRGVR